MDNNSEGLQQNTIATEDKTDSQPDYSPDSQVEASFVNESLDTQLPMQNSIQNAQFNINNPVMPVKDMVRLEEVHKGAIDRILAMGEREQSFTHGIVQSQHDDQLKITNRNIGISKEQNSFNFQKLYIVSGFIFVLIVCATYLFVNDKMWGGLAFSLGFLVLASIFILGYFPSRIFEAMFNKSTSNNQDEE